MSLKTRLDRHGLCLLVGMTFLLTPGYGQQIYRPNQEVHIDNLKAVGAKSAEPTAVLVAALETVLHDKELCCGRDSGLEDSVLAADPSSLKDVAAKLQGRQHFADGRPVIITAQFVPSSEINSGQVIQSIRDKQALIMQWNSHIYVIYGVEFYETVDNSQGSLSDSIEKLLLLDLRFSDSRRTVVFDRQADDWQKVQGILSVTTTLP